MHRDRKDYFKNYNKQHYIDNKEKYLERNKEYRNAPMGRACKLVWSYKKMDRRNGFGDVIDFDAKWMVDNIFPKPCAHCGKEGWQIIGCNRLDNTKGHTKDNVEPCCKECNSNEYGKDTAMKVYQYTPNNKLVAIWNSTQEAQRNGYKSSNISLCCQGKRKTCQGYKWSYNPL